MKKIHEKLADIAKEHGGKETLAYLQKVVETNKKVQVQGGCPGHEGECGACVDGVFIPCGQQS